LFVSAMINRAAGPFACCRRFRGTETLLVALLLAACGGGSGGGGDESNNNAPRATSANSVTVVEGSAPAYSVTGRDPDGDSFSVRLAEEGDFAAFIFDDADNTLSFNPASDFETPRDGDADNTYEVVFVLEDRFGAETRHTVAISVTDAEEAPVISSNDLSVLEGETFVGYVDAVDSDGDTLTFSVTGGSDASALSLDSQDGELNLLAAPDFEAPSDNNGDGVYEIGVRVSDGALADEAMLSISVVNANQLALSIGFPPVNAELTGLQATVAVTGHFTDAEDGEVSPGQVEQITVNESAGDLDPQRPERWSGSVSTGIGSLDIQVSALPDTGDAVTQSRRLSNQPVFDGTDVLPLTFLGQEYVVIASPATQRLLALERQTGERVVATEDTTIATLERGWDDGPDLFGILNAGNEIVATDSQAGMQSTVLAPSDGFGNFSDMASDPAGRLFIAAESAGQIIEYSDAGVQVFAGSGTGVSVPAPRALALDIPGSRLFVVSPGEIIALDTGTGASTSIASFTADQFGTRIDLVYDATRDRLILAGEQDIHDIDPDTGNITRSALSADTGVPETGFTPRRIAIDPATDRIVGLDRYYVQEKDPLTLEGDLLSSSIVGAGPRMRNPVTFALDDAARVFYVIHSNMDGDASLIQIDMADGVRSELAPSNMPSDAAYSDAVGLHYDASGHELFWYQNSGTGAVARMDLDSGEVTFPFSSGGGGPQPGNVSDMALDTAAGEAYLTATDERAVYRADFATDTYELVSGDSRGAGPGFATAPQAVALDQANGRLLLGTLDNILYGVDIGTGDRSDLWPALSGAADPMLEAITSLWLDADSGEVFMADAGELAAFDPQTDVGRLIRGATRGDGPDVQTADLLYDPQTRVLYALDGRGAMVALEPVSGDSVVANGNSGFNLVP
jgi:hypothetical protein